MVRALITPIFDGLMDNVNRGLPRKKRNQLTSPSKVYWMYAPLNFEKVSELLYKRQAAGAWVQVVQAASGEYCMTGSRSSIIVDTKFVEDICSGKTEGGVEQERSAMPSSSRAVGRVDSGSSCDRSTC